MSRKLRICTINTDAGYYPVEKKGSYAYWIKSDGLFLKGSGLLKQDCGGPYEAEMKALINAMSALLKSGFINIDLIIFNRDNIYTKSSKKGNELERMLAALIAELKKKCGCRTKRLFFKFRHVKAHRSTSTPKEFVNDWCDQECKRRLREWKQHFIAQKNNQDVGISNAK